ncbi:MAG: DUF3253 domain-containing protein [Oceanicaulis sp.]|uniref:DUF3253 domain-containing protein n=1 Tax=Glycocaulis sp. TaxID=1969725 RepID=UPI0025C37EEC|nr:DUF3253 domain-containing protein [Glycocaulis sp.]MCC5981766.1 DUF3253 domain-containing protein [Oceanicaulis sp.]MCH8522335.1 DUF3253 domain-containing protein [Glycocaulis sp.]
MSKNTIETAILALVEQRGVGKSICPSEAARAVWPEDWQKHMREVRAVAVGMARKGEISILRKGKPVDPEDFRGVYRLSLPVGDGD